MNAKLGFFLSILLILFASFGMWFDVSITRTPRYGSAAYHSWIDNFFLRFCVYDNSLYWLLGFVVIITFMLGYLFGKKNSGKKR